LAFQAMRAGEATKHARSMSEVAEAVVAADPRDGFAQIDSCVPRLSRRKGRNGRRESRLVAAVKNRPLRRETSALAVR
jgi:hypothetical protein